jgi:hypothetical protein
MISFLNRNTLLICNPPHTEVWGNKGVVKKHTRYNNCPALYSWEPQRLRLKNERINCAHSSSIMPFTSSVFG